MNTEDAKAARLYEQVLNKPPESIVSEEKYKARRAALKRARFDDAFALFMGLALVAAYVLSVIGGLRRNVEPLVAHGAVTPQNVLFVMSQLLGATLFVVLGALVLQVAIPSLRNHRRQREELDQGIWSEANDSPPSLSVAALAVFILAPFVSTLTLTVAHKANFVGAAALSALYVTLFLIGHRRSVARYKRDSNKRTHETL